jgi:hypothetical protein
MNMISKINFSNLIPVKHKSPIGNPDGYYLTPTPDKKKRKNKSQPQRQSNLLVALDFIPT